MILATRLWLTEVIFCCGVCGRVFSWLAMALCVLLVGGEIGFLWCEVS